jgi:hypothetical protein
LPRSAGRCQARPRQGLQLWVEQPPTAGRSRARSSPTLRQGPPLRGVLLPTRRRRARPRWSLRRGPSLRVELPRATRQTCARATALNSR